MSSAPNILVVMADQHRADVLGERIDPDSLTVVGMNELARSRRCLVLSWSRAY